MEWSSRVCAGVTKIITGRRGNVMEFKHKHDLCACLNLLESSQNLMFSWDISIYSNSPPLKQPRVASAQVGSLIGDLKYEDPEEDYDDEGYDAIARPEWNRGEVRIVKQITTPYWYMARYVLFAFLTVFGCILILLFNKILVGLTVCRTNEMASGWQLYNDYIHKIKDPIGKERGSLMVL